MADPDRARAQHRAYVQALQELGARVVTLPADDACPDCCFIEDTAVLVGGAALITRPGAPQRRAEPKLVAEALAALGLSCSRVRAPAALDGGDVLDTGRRLLVGRSERTNDAGVQALRTAFPDREVVPVPVRGPLHLKTVVTFVGAGTFAARPDVAPIVGIVTAAAGDGRVIYAEAGEDANCLLVRDTVLVPASSPRLAERLRRTGLQTRELDISEFQKADGGLTCLSLALGPEPGSSPVRPG